VRRCFFGFPAGEEGLWREGGRMRKASGRIDVRGKKCVSFAESYEDLTALIRILLAAQPLW
jgi:hypothetical protein